MGAIARLRARHPPRLRHAGELLRRIVIRQERVAQAVRRRLPRLGRRERPVAVGPGGEPVLRRAVELERVTGRAQAHGQCRPIRLFPFSHLTPHTLSLPSDPNSRPHFTVGARKKPQRDPPDGRRSVFMSARNTSRSSALSILPPCASASAIARSNAAASPARAWARA